jgi:hypothetical protein
MSNSRILESFVIGLSFLIWILFPIDSFAYFADFVSEKLPYNRKLESEADYVRLMLAARVQNSFIYI